MLQIPFTERQSVLQVSVSFPAKSTTLFLHIEWLAASEGYQFISVNFSFSSAQVIGVKVKKLTLPGVFLVVFACVCVILSVNSSKGFQGTLIKTGGVETLKSTKVYNDLLTKKWQKALKLFFVSCNDIESTVWPLLYGQIRSNIHKMTFTFKTVLIFAKYILCLY